MQRRKNEPIPSGWALDSTGKITNDANEAMSGALMPLGGEERNSGYKGYGLAMMVEIFCGLLSGQTQTYLHISCFLFFYIINIGNTMFVS